MKIGEIEFEIESPIEQLHIAVDQILTTVTEHQKNLNLTQPLERQAYLPRTETCRGTIQKLYEANYFNQPRSLEQVHAELLHRGSHYDRTAVAHALVDLVKESILRREGRPRGYTYIQIRAST